MIYSRKFPDNYISFPVGLLTGSQNAMTYYLPCPYRLMKAVAKGEYEERRKA
jgi:hypothetical protein